ncbi:MAG: dephospho-CoA kinase [Ruminococcaceae bacterium]|nr:dephospho-CoA kinase [Oscillospiraceae bacterium]
MLTVGLTGATGAGKGALCEIFEKYGIHCLDTDLVSRLVCKPGMPCTLELAKEFGEDILLKDGSLDRKALAKKVFSIEKNDALLEKLNAITHKYILAYADKWLEDQRASGAKAAVIDAPVLFESGYDKKCDYIIGVTADKELRIRRIIQRDNIDTELAKKRAGLQKDDEYLKKHCSVVFSNNGDRQALEELSLDCIKALAEGIIPTS